MLRFYKINKQSYLLLNQIGGKGQLTASQTILIKRLPDLTKAASQRNDQSFPRIPVDYVNELRDYAVEEENWKSLNKKELAAKFKFDDPEYVKRTSRRISDRLKRLQTESNSVNWGLITNLVNVFMHGVPNGAPDWIISKYVDGGINRFEDIESRVKPKIKFLDELRKNRPEFTNNTLETFRSLNELEEFIERASPVLEEIKDEKNPGIKDAEIVYNGKSITIIKPTSEEGSCYYGKGTSWCTAVKSKRNMYKHYAEEGPLYIIQPKKPGNGGKEKYQLHFPSQQYMNEEDISVDIEELVSKYPEIIYVLDDPEIDTYPSLKFVQIVNRINPEYFSKISRKISGVQIDDSDEIIDEDGITMIPDGITHITFGSFFNQPIINDAGFRAFPDGVTNITFGPGFNKPVMNDAGFRAFPDSVTHITFGDDFNQPLINNAGVRAIPDGVTSITFRYSFNQPLMNDKGDRALPDSVTHITFGNDFNQPLINNAGVRAIPDGVTSITFHYSFNQPLMNDRGDRAFPDGVTNITLGSNFNKPVMNDKGDRAFPDSVTHITFSYDFNQPIMNDRGDRAIPNSVTNITFGNNFNQPIMNDKGFRALPDSVTSITFASRFNQPIINDAGVRAIPDGVTSITFGWLFNQPIINNRGERAFPDGVVNITFGDHFNQPIMNDRGDRAFPDSVTNITFGSYFNQPVTDYAGNIALPSSLTTLNSVPVTDIREHIKNGHIYTRS